MENGKPNVEPFLVDYVDTTRDKGERWVIGRRAAKSEVQPLDGVTLPDRKDEPIEVALILRRVPLEVAKEIEERFCSWDERKDLAGNTSRIRTFTPQALFEVAFHRQLWMWKDTENFVVSVGDDPEAMAMYSHAMGRPVVAEEWVQLDGHLNENVKRHLLQRFKDLRMAIEEAHQTYEAKDSQREAALRGNSQRGSTSALSGRR